MSFHKRKQQLNDPVTQRTLMWRVLRHWLLFGGGLFLVLLACEMVVGGSGRSFGDHVRELWTRHGLVFLFIAAVLPTIAYDIIKLSSRFTGPVLRLKRELKRLASDEPAQPLAFRANDFWHDLTEDFNGALERIQELHGHETAAARAVNAAADGPAAPDPSDTAADLDEVVAAVGQAVASETSERRGNGRVALGAGRLGHR
ncbi:MAG TPA: hypothetical protein VML55_03625 [Planctomycetaceae bacterium]|nr:hypothetical protein [Planctomycetaceae bacterium]